MTYSLFQKNIFTAVLLLLGYVAQAQTDSTEVDDAQVDAQVQNNIDTTNSQVKPKKIQVSAACGVSINGTPYVQGFVRFLNERKICDTYIGLGTSFNSEYPIVAETGLLFKIQKSDFAGVIGLQYNRNFAFPLGMRYQPKGGDLFFQTSLNPIISNKGNFTILPQLNLGYTFGTINRDPRLIGLQHAFYINPAYGRVYGLGYDLRWRRPTWVNFTINAYLGNNSLRLFPLAISDFRDNVESTNILLGGSFLIGKGKIALEAGGNLCYTNVSYRRFPIPNDLNSYFYLAANFGIRYQPSKSGLFLSVNHSLYVTYPQNTIILNDIGISGFRFCVGYTLKVKEPYQPPVAVKTTIPILGYSFGTK